jgi:hypothetical protein
MKYTGTPDTVCPITFKPLDEITDPVVFICHPSQPYEAEALAQWLSVRTIVPHSNESCTWLRTPAEIISPLAGHCLHPATAMSYFRELRVSAFPEVFYFI